MEKECIFASDFNDMWYLHFFNPPKRDDYRGGIFETDKMGEKPEADLTFLYILTTNGVSGCWVRYNDDGYPILGIVPDDMDIKPLLKELFNIFGTVCTDESVFEDAQLFEGMEQDEVDVMWNYLFLSQMLARQIVTIDSEWSKNILAQCLKYMHILDKYKLFFTKVNFFAPSDDALKEHDDELQRN